MADLTGRRLAVAGAGVFGLCVALRAVAAGASVEVWDPAPLGDNASGVAAGMIAPLSEVVFDASSADHFELFRAGRDRWRAFERLAPGLQIDRAGTVLLFEDEAARQAAEVQAGRLGAEATRVTPAHVLGFTLPIDKPALFTREDRRVDSVSALTALANGFINRGGVFKAQAMTPEEVGAFDAVVVAAGMQSDAFAAVAPELSLLSPIKGQIVRLEGAPSSGPVVRATDLYLAPQDGGLLAGATMEPGRRDDIVDQAVVAILRARALRIAPRLAPFNCKGSAAVRAATPDGLPLAGPSGHAGLFLATGARRNGWLLAPLVSEILVSYLSGGDGGPLAAKLDPRRAFA